MADISFHGEAETLVPFAGIEDQYRQWIANIARQENKTINYKLIPNERYKIYWNIRNSCWDLMRF